MSLAQILPNSLTTSTNMELANGGGAGAKNLTTFLNAKKKSAPNKAVQGRRHYGENGFEEGGGYMAVKRAKLDNQFNKSARGLNGNDTIQDISEIFKGISIYINGYTNPPEPELREIFVLHGGTFHPYNSSKTTYVVATNMSAPTKMRHGLKAITPDWIMDSIEAGYALDTRKYKLYNHNQEKNQMTLTQIISSAKNSDGEAGSNCENSSNSIHEKKDSTNPATNGNSLGFETKGNGLECATNGSNGTSGSNIVDHDDDRERVSDSEEEFFECSQELFPSPARNMPIKPVTSVTPPKTTFAEISNENSTNSGVQRQLEEIEVVDLPSSNESVKECTTPPKNLDRLAINQTSTSPTANKGIKTATDDGFIEDFFGRSRLHLISDQKKEMQALIGNLRRNIDSHTFSGLQKFESEIEAINQDTGSGLSFSNDEVILMHVDLDCFFASVGLLSRPHLRGKPVVVTHCVGKTHDSRSDIACASYEARKYGIRNGMWVGDARTKCADLEVIPYDFEEYRRISKIFFETVSSVTLDIEPNSVDEMLIDVTSVLKKVPGATPEALAAFFRRIIVEETGCPASIGIGSNRLLAKLAVKLAKPDGLHHLKDNDALAYIQGLPVRDLPGVGFTGEDKLRESFNVQTCGDLLNVSLKDLKAVFGEKTGEKMFKGIDTQEIKIGFERPKSLSVDVNFGIRFTKEDEVTQFLMKICKELSTRAERIQAVAKHFSLKLLIRKKGAGDPIKPGGHGIVDSMTRSRSLLNPTRNWHEFFKTAAAIIRQMRVPPSEYRGVGVVLTDLSFDCDKVNKKSVQRTLTDMPISRAQKMLSIISQKNNKTPMKEFQVANKVDSVYSVSSSFENNSTVGSSRAEDSDVVKNGSHDVLANNVTNVSFVQNSNNSVPINDHENSVKGGKNDLSKLPVDITVLRQLPREIAEEQCKFYGISKDLLDEKDDNDAGSESETAKEAKVDKYYDNVQSVDQEFLLALPENVRQDVLIQLQEAKGRRTVADPVVPFDDQQPCSSRQALERSKKLELDLKKSSEIGNIVSSVNEDSNISEQPLSEKTTPVINYANYGKNQYVSPKLFWDVNAKYPALPAKPCNRPALNACVETGEVRNMIRTGLEVVTDPLPEDAEHLEKYFIRLISDGWIEQTQVLLKFIYRKTVELGPNAKWTPFLKKIIDNTQECCKRLYQGELRVE